MQGGLLGRGSAAARDGGKQHRHGQSRPHPDSYSGSSPEVATNTQLGSVESRLRSKGPHVVDVAVGEFRGEGDSDFRHAALQGRTRDAGVPEFDKSGRRLAAPGYAGLEG
jgi:hypothetical protein